MSKIWLCQITLTIVQHHAKFQEDSLLVTSKSTGTIGLFELRNFLSLGNFIDIPQPVLNKNCRTRNYCWKWNLEFFTSTQNKEECGILAMCTHIYICCQRVVGIDKKYHPKSVKAPFFTLLCSHLTDLK